MKILYGVQGTGNGHITRARTMARALREVGVEVDWVFSGRARDKFFDMEPFENFRTLRGLTFAIEGGRLRYSQTILKNNLFQLRRDIASLDVSGYDLILNDFEPVSAWAAKRAGKRVIGVSHQNAFLNDIPKQGNSTAVAWFMRNFAPSTLPIGVHWHHFGQPILPPLVEPSSYPNEPCECTYLMYLPLNELDQLIQLLRPFSDCQFMIYHGVSAAHDLGNIHIRPFSREGFQRDLHRCEGVICNAGFELASESIQLGRKLLVRPIDGQMEQLSNALALRQLGYGSVTRSWTPAAIRNWLPEPRPEPVPYPDVAKALAIWIQQGANNFDELFDDLWRDLPAPAKR